MPTRLSIPLLSALLLALAAGCGGGQPPAEKPDDSPSPAVTKTPTESTSTTEAEAPPAETAAAPPAKKRFQAIELGGGSGNTSSTGGSSAETESALSREQHIAAVIEQLQPFQVLLGKWTWTTKKKFDGFAKHAEDLQWVWDFRSDIRQPSLAFTSDEHPYFAKGTITWLPESKQFRLTTTGREGDSRVFLGTWADNGEPKEEHDGKVVQRSYKLELLQQEPSDGEQWKVVLQLLDNDQMLTDVTKRAPSGSSYSPVDVVRQQRVGTSFAVAESDNPGPKCIVSGGLGTIMVSYKGQNYFVCCTGCVAAFEEDPERWLAKMKK